MCLFAEPNKGFEDMSIMYEELTIFALAADFIIALSIQIMVKPIGSLRSCFFAAATINATSTTPFPTLEVMGRITARAAHLLTFSDG